MASFDLDDPRLIFMPEEDVLKHGGYVHHIKNSWWSVVPGKGLIFFCHGPARKKSLKNSSPQCNANEHCARVLNERLYPGTEVKFFPSVLQPIDLQDFL